MIRFLYNQYDGTFMMKVHKNQSDENPIQPSWWSSYLSNLMKLLCNQYDETLIEPIWWSFYLTNVMKLLYSTYDETYKTNMM